MKNLKKNHDNAIFIQFLLLFIFLLFSKQWEIGSIFFLNAAPSFYSKNKESSEKQFRHAVNPLKAILIEQHYKN
ncbi:unnamed protein product [Blepharisma stoltei]|uniref:Uncharacterized protein n=1 Tax=Blepharisma stoltei TaxID=1481888 RepID=A0AAU9JES3_9CILI|nr:unnamed protein product [Blepharisma stoltei]